MHQLAIFNMPQTIVHKLYGLLAWFFWQGSSNQGIHWKKRTTLHLSKGLRGLNLRSIETSSEVLLMRKASCAFNNTPNFLSLKLIILLAYSQGVQLYPVEHE